MKRVVTLGEIMLRLSTQDSKDLSRRTVLMSVMAEEKPTAVFPYPTMVWKPDLSQKCQTMKLDKAPSIP